MGERGAYNQIATGLFLFLLGTKIGRSSAIHSDVKYEPNRIAIREQIDQSPLLIPELGPPPYIPNFVHQGSNYFFGMPFPMQGPPPAPVVENIVEINEQDCKDVVIVPKPELTDILVGNEQPVYRNPLIVDEMVQAPMLPLPVPNLPLNVHPIPQLPSVPVPITLNSVNSQFPLPQFHVPVQSINIPSLPLTTAPIAQQVPMLIEGPVRSSGDFIVSEVDVRVQSIPPPPELPPLVFEEVLKPVMVEEKEVIIVPSPPETLPLFPPSVVVAGKSRLPTLCAQDIVFERILPNLGWDKTKVVELISLPASRRVPVVTKPFSFLKK